MQIKTRIPTLTEQWKAIYERERPRLSPNAITGEALAAYVQITLSASPYPDEAFLNAIRADVKNDAFFAEKLKGAEPDPAAFRYRDGTLIGIDRVSGWFIAENDRVRDKLTYVKGLDEADLAHVIRTVDWLRCKQMLESERKTRSGVPPKKPFCNRRNAERSEQER